MSADNCASVSSVPGGGECLRLSNVAAFPLILVKTACKSVSFDDGHTVPASFVVATSLTDSVEQIILLPTSTSTLSKSRCAPPSESSLQ
ncbi:hypothetical protein OG21DRAFT_1185648 [Imleria badia]|nr:hypothetical protein OG21DRAFT_1185648 [Imleria badia]